MNTDERTQTSIDTFITPATEAGSITLRPFSAGTLTICRALGLTMVVSGDKEQVEALSADDKQRQLTTFLFIQSQPFDVVKKAVKLARENRQAFEDEYLLAFELELPVKAMFTAMTQLENNLTAIEAAQIGAVNAVNSLAGALMAVAQALWEALVESIKNAITLFQIVTTADFWIGMGKAIMGIAQGIIAFLLDGIAKLLDYLSGIPLIGEKIGQGSKEMQGWADSVCKSGQDNRDAGGDLLTHAFDKAATRMRDAFDNIGTALISGFDKGNSLIDTSDWEQHLGDAVGSVMDRVQSVSEQSRKAVEPAKPSGPMIDPEEDASKGKKPAIFAIQRIGCGGAAYGAGDPMLREKQRQTRELTTQTGLLRDVKRLLDRTPTKTVPLTPAFG